MSSRQNREKGDHLIDPKIPAAIGCFLILNARETAGLHGKLRYLKISCENSTEERLLRIDDDDDFYSC